jgi:uncharacterized membrane-anchored protein
MRAGLAQTHSRRGDLAAARAEAGRLGEAAQQRYVSPCLLAQVHAALGDAPRAMDLLRRAAEAHDPELIYLGVRTSYDALRPLPELTELRTRVRV